MRMLRIIFLCLTAAVLLFMSGLYIVVKSFDSSGFLSQIAQKASVRLGRTVSFGHLGVGLSSAGITFDLSPVTVSDDPSFTAQPFIKVDRVRAGVDLKSLIFHRKIHISGIILQSLQVHLIRSMGGDMNIRSMLSSNRPAEVTAADKAGLLQAPVAGTAGRIRISKPSWAQELPSSVEAVPITIQNGSFSFIDQAAAMPLDIWLNDINAKLSGGSLTKPFDLSLDAALYSKDPNVHLNASAAWDNAGRRLLISGLRLRADLSREDISALNGISPRLLDDPAFKNMTGVILLNIAHLETGLAASLTADGDLHIVGGVIRNFNGIRTLLSHTLGSFGWVEGNVVNLLNGQVKDKLNERDTVLEQGDAVFSFHDQTLFLDDLLLKTDMFEFKARGSVDRGLNADFQTMLHLNSDVSAALVHELEGLKFLYDDTERIAVGASLSGVIPHLKYKPNKDFRKRSKKALFKEGSHFLGILLGGGQK